MDRIFDIDVLGRKNYFFHFVCSKECVSNEPKAEIAEQSSLILRKISA